MYMVREFRNNRYVTKKKGLRDMNIYLHEIKSYRWNTILWSGAISGLMLLFMCFYPVFQTDLDTYMEFMNNFPDTIKAAMGIYLEDFQTPVGYYAFTFTYSALLAAIQAMNLGVGIVSKEERERTADFLMTKPVSRASIISAKLFAAFTIILFTNIIYNIVSFFTVYGFAEETVDITKLWLINLSLFFLQLIFFSIGLAVTAFMKKVKTVLPISLGIVFAFFAVSAFAVTSKDDKLRFITPFQYFTTQQILDHSSYEVVFVILGVVITAAGIITGYYRYIRKNIPAL